MRAEAQNKAREDLEKLEQARVELEQLMTDFVNANVDDMTDRPLAFLATEFDAEPESNNTTYYGIGAAAFTTIAAAAYLYRKRQEAKGMTDEFQRV